VIIGLSDIRSYRLIHRIPLYFDTPDPSYLDPASYQKGSTLDHELPPRRLSSLVRVGTTPPKTVAHCRGSALCTNCAEFIALGYDNMLCSLAGRPHTPQQREHKVHQRVVRFFSKALVGSQLNWSAREKECYGIYYGVKLFEGLLDNRYFILKTDHMNLTYINVTFTGQVLRWKLYL